MMRLPIDLPDHRRTMIIYVSGHFKDGRIRPCQYKTATGKVRVPDLGNVVFLHTA